MYGKVRQEGLLKSLNFSLIYDFIVRENSLNFSQLMQNPMASQTFNEN